jgi:uncharacterized membrane protein
MSQVRFGLAAGLMLVLALTGSVVEAQGIPRYTAIDLGDASQANGINDAGQIVGAQENHAVIWNNRVPSVLAANYTASHFAVARAINNHGQIAGQVLAESSNGVLTTAGAVWDSPTSAITGQFSGSVNQNGDARGINDSGQVVGITPDGAILFEHGTATLLAADAEAFDINNAGVIVGSAVFDHGTVTPIIVPPFRSSGAASINNNGQYVGVSTPDGVHYRATLWTNGAASGLADMPRATVSRARGINDAGQIVGESGDHAVLWESGSAQPVALGELPGTSTSVANAINASGQIVGTSGGHAVVWERRVGTQPYAPVN